MKTMALDWKTGRIKAEWNELPVHNARLARIVKLLVEYVDLEMGKNVVLTEILRTSDETQKLYAATVVAGGAVPSWRPHEIWNAVDLRSSLYTDREIEKIVAFLNQFTVYKGQRRCAVFHAIRGGAPHMHAQCPPAESP
jgi:hypothetical protein